MNIKKELNAPRDEDSVSLEEHVKSSDVFNSKNSSITFDYHLNDKAIKTKLLKAAKRTPIEVEENSSSTNLVFSAGAWYHTVLPSVRYFEEVKGDKTLVKTTLLK